MLSLAFLSILQATLFPFNIFLFYQVSQRPFLFIVNNSYHLNSVSCVPATVLSTLHILTHLIVTTTPWERYYYNLLFPYGENMIEVFLCVIEVLNDVPQLTQRVSGCAEMLSWGDWLQAQLLSFLYHFWPMHTYMPKTRLEVWTTTAHATGANAARNPSLSSTLTILILLTWRYVS